MPSKSDIQFGKIALKNHFAAKDEVESCLKDQSRFEKERHTTVLEAVLLARDVLDVGKIEAIQKAMKRRVVFCAKCSAKYNVFQFKGGDKFACNKCGARVEVPDESSYRKMLRHQAGEVNEVLSGTAAVDHQIESEAEEAPHRETIILTRESIEAAKAMPRPAPEEPEDTDEEAEVEVEEVELEAVVEEEPEVEEPAAEEPPPVLEEIKPSPAPQEARQGAKPLRKIKLRSGAPPKQEKPATTPEQPSKAPAGSPPRKVKLIRKSEKPKKSR